MLYFDENNDLLWTISSCQLWTICYDYATDENFLWQVALRWTPKLQFYDPRNTLDWQSFSSQSHSLSNNSFRSTRWNICPNISFGIQTILNISCRQFQIALEKRTSEFQQRTSVFMNHLIKLFSDLYLFSRFFDIKIFHFMRYFN